jgi:carbohydrate diacid regulator
MPTRSTSPRPSRQLRTVLLARMRDLDAISRKVIENLRKDIPVYGSIRDEAVLADVLASVRENLAIAFEGYLEGCNLPEERFEVVSQFIRKRARQGVPLDAVLRAYRVSCSVIWGSILAAARTDPALRDEILFKLSPRTIYHVDLFSRIVQRAYMTELRDRYHLRDRAKQELSRLALDGDADEQVLRAQATALGLEPFALYSAIAFELRQPESGALLPSIETSGLLENLARLLGVNPANLVEARIHGRLVAWMPHAASCLAAQATDPLMAACRSLCGPDSIVERAGLSTALRGIGSWKTASEQALKALDIGKSVEPSTQIHRYSSLAICDLVTRTPEVAEFLRTILEVLSGEEELLRCAETYFATGRHLKATAARVGVHRNTLKYRLLRVQTLLGGSFDDPDWSLRLELAFKLRRMR